MRVIEHYIERAILERLMHAAELRFSELKPDGMESNIFMYHLKQLMKAGYVEKTDGTYRLAAAGLSYVDGLSTESHKPRQQPKLIAIIALHDGAGNWLLAERKTQPYIGSRMFPSGKQHRGETSTEHALRELAEKTGLTNVGLTYRGVADVQIRAGDTLLTHVVAMVYEATLSHQVLPPETGRFRYVWHDFATDDASLMPGTRELYAQLQKPGTFNAAISSVIIAR